MAEPEVFRAGAFRDEASNCLFRFGHDLPVPRGALSDLSLILFFRRFDVDVRRGDAHIEFRPDPRSVS